MAQQSSADFRGTLGRYSLFGEIASGGMATVHLARQMGPAGFARTVAIKRLHPHLSKDPDFVAMFLEEARLAARVRHPNVVATLDVIDEGSELFLVMEYVVGESLSRLVRKTREAGKRVPPRFVVGIVCAALDGLHAAHDATSERGVPLGIVHRDVSPQNVHVGLDGVTRVLDFGIAKATNRVQETRTDQLKGKVAYMSPEQLAKGAIDRRADVYSASVVLWEALTSARLFQADDVPSLVYAIMNEQVRPPSSIVPNLPKGLDEIVMKGLDRRAENRWSSAREMAVALEKVLAPAPTRDIGEWVRDTAGDMLAWRIELVRRIESK
ncbi:MAG TPA: serine/threonine-protein kinase, partial [Labilithrix sp.]|nr:serine/threonine-protein kinase [Labilithrix sp.]